MKHIHKQQPLMTLALGCVFKRCQPGDFSLHPKSSEKAPFSLQLVASGVIPFWTYKNTGTIRTLFVKTTKLFL
jgi:hypothetical protein